MPQSSPSLALSSPSSATRLNINADWIDADCAVDRMIRCENTNVKVYVCSFIMQSGDECGRRSRKLKVFSLKKLRKKRFRNEIIIQSGAAISSVIAYSTGHRNTVATPVTCRFAAPTVCETMSLVGLDDEAARAPTTDACARSTILTFIVAPYAESRSECSPT